MRQRSNHAMQGMLFLAFCIIIAGVLFRVIVPYRATAANEVTSNATAEPDHDDASAVADQSPAAAAPDEDASPDARLTSPPQADEAPRAEYGADQPSGAGSGSVAQDSPSRPRRSSSPVAEGSVADAAATSDSAAARNPPSDDDLFAPH